MSIEAWADAARQINFGQNAEQERAIDTLQSLFKGNIDPDTAAARISSIYEPSLKQNPGGNPEVVNFWGILCHAIRALGGNKELLERLVDLLNSISKLPDVTDDHGNTIVSPWSKGVFWRNLPEFSWMFRENAIYIESEDEMEGNWDDQAVPLLNATTFAAMYLARGVRPAITLWYTEDALASGIEVPYQTPKQQRNAAMYVPLAATWLLYAGERIYELCKSDYNRKDGAKGYTETGDEWLYGKGTGYSLDRWAFWKKRFSEIAATQGLRDDIKDIAARAASEMQKIESQT